MAARFERHGVTAIVCLVSPYRDGRDFARSICRRFIEVHVATSVVVCAERDPKGLYRRAREGNVQRLTGLSDPYEPPLSPECVIDTSTLTVDAAVSAVLACAMLPLS